MKQFWLNKLLGLVSSSHLYHHNSSGSAVFATLIIATIKAVSSLLKKNSNTSSILLLVFLLGSCSAPTKEKIFKEKYGAEVSKINADRIPSQEVKKEVMTSSPPSHEEWLEASSVQYKENKYSYVNVDRYDNEQKKYLPDKDYYDQMKAYNPSNAVPNDLFSPKYDTVLYAKFRQTGAEFDVINIPPKDAYGVVANLAKKQYAIIGNNSLQESLDVVNDIRTKRDVEVSKILIDEQKAERRKQRTIRNFGESAIDENYASNEDANNKSKSVSIVATNAAARSDVASKNTKSSSAGSFFLERIIKN